MGKPTGFMEITRQTSLELPPEERIRNFNEFHVPLHTDEQQAQGARRSPCSVRLEVSGHGCSESVLPRYNLISGRGWDGSPLPDAE